MVVCGLSLHQGSTESRKTLEQKFIFQIGTLNPHGINDAFHSRGAVRGFRVKRDLPNLFSVIRNKKEIEFVNRE